jgi:hypothetical protein
MMMMTDYKATPEQWEVQEKFAPESEDACCLLELRSRIERLELGAGIHDVVSKELKNSLLPDPKRSLIQRVHSCIVGEPECGHMQARAVIREVANWMREQEGDYSMIVWLEQEIDDD